MRAPIVASLVTLLALVLVGEVRADLLDTEGRALGIEELSGGAPLALIVIKGDWCPACRAQLEDLAARRGEVAASGGRIAVVSTDGTARNARLRDELNLGVPVLHDEDAALLRSVGLWSERAGHPFPGVVFIDACGDVDTVHAGRRPGTLQTEAILAALRDLAAPGSPCAGLRV